MHASSKPLKSILRRYQAQGLYRVLGFALKALTIDMRLILDCFCMEFKAMIYS